MLVWVKRCICYVKDMESLLVIIFAILGCVNSISELLGLTLISFVVILDSPAGMSSDVWIYVQENVAKITKVRKTQCQI